MRTVHISNIKFTLLNNIFIKNKLFTMCLKIYNQKQYYIQAVDFLRGYKPRSEMVFVSIFFFFTKKTFNLSITYSKIHVNFSQLHIYISLKYETLH